jgi:hypothetical protein
MALVVQGKILEMRSPLSLMVLDRVRYADNDIEHGGSGNY